MQRLRARKAKQEKPKASTEQPEKLISTPKLFPASRYSLGAGAILSFSSPALSPMQTFDAGNSPSCGVVVSDNCAVDSPKPLNERHARGQDKNETSNQLPNQRSESVRKGNSSNRDKDQRDAVRLPLSTKTINDSSRSEISPVYKSLPILESEKEYEAGVKALKVVDARTVSENESLQPSKTNTSDIHKFAEDSSDDDPFGILEAHRIAIQSTKNNKPTKVVKIDAVKPQPRSISPFDSSSLTTSSLTPPLIMIDTSLDSVEPESIDRLEILAAAMQVL